MREDARHTATLILKQLQQSPLKDTFCCYGTQNSVLIGIGRESSLDQVETTTLDVIWSGIHDYLEANSNDYIFGFIGFDPENLLHKNIENYRQKTDLFVPKTVIECKNANYSILKGDAEIKIKDHPLNSNNVAPVDISEIDQSELLLNYTESVSDFIEAIKNGTIERATLARKVPSDKKFDLPSSFTSDHSQHAQARSFYFSNEYVAFTGQSPELLAEGNLDSFSTHKLSGTYAKNNKKSTSELITQFQCDSRIIAEHQSSILAIENSLTNIGTVQATKFEVMELPALLHGWSTFITRPNKNITVANCLRSIFPFGVNPVKQGFKLLAKHENFSRGPYYGLTGCIRPNGEFSFTQTLRSVFIDNNNSYLMVGAAITGLSTAELEMKETCTKLSSIKVFECINDTTG